MNKVRSDISVLHITPWFPADDDPFHGVFIARHISSIQDSVRQQVLHISLKMPDSGYTETRQDGIIRISGSVPITSWRLYEWLWMRKLRRELKRMRAKSTFTHVVFHVAYPALVHLRHFEKLLPTKKLIVEHWSAYYFNFNSTKKPHRLARLFQHNIPIATVSNRLAKDIEEFTGKPLKCLLLPNVIDEKTFHHQELSTGSHFLMHAFWKHPKKPLEVFAAILELHNQGTDIQLRVSGDGPYLASMQEFVAIHQLEFLIQFIGPQSGLMLAEEMNMAQALIHPTSYESFSVVVAESLCCGCPVLADKVGALPELINHTNGVLRQHDKSWAEIILHFKQDSFDRKKIASDMSMRYDSKTIGQRFYQILNEL